MAIVRMKKLSLLAVRSQKDALLRELMLLGCVELHEQDDIILDPSMVARVTRETSDAPDRRAKKNLVADAIRLLDKYAPQKSKLLAPKPEMSEKEFMDEKDVETAKQTAKDIVSLDERIRSYTTEEARQSLLIESLKPWAGFELPLDTAGTRCAGVVLGSVPAAADMGELSSALAQKAGEAQLYEVGSDEALHYLSVIYYRGVEEAVMQVLREHGFAAPAFGSVKGTAADNIHDLESSIDKLRRDRSVCTTQMQSYSAQRQQLKLCFDRMCAEVEEAEAAEKLVKTESVVSLQGWTTEPEEGQLKALLDRFACAYELTDPPEEEYGEVPVKLKNNKFTHGLNMVTNMYSLPRYGTLDPNPLMAPFFILFYGIMMADMGYGLIMTLGALFVLKKAKPKGGMQIFCELLFECGIATFIMGAVTGGFFGDAPLQVARMLNPDTTFTGLPALFDPLNDTIYVLIGAMVLGFIQLVTGMVVNFVYRAKHGQLADAIWEEGTWWVIILGIILAVLKIGSISGVPVVLVIGLLMLFYGSGRNAKGIGKVTAVFGAIYNGVTGWFGDILSYSRLMALMLAGSVIAQVFNTLGALPGNIIVFAIIFLAGHTLNFGLNLLGCYVHDLRLQCLEYFGKFYQDGGKPFKPLAIRTKYYDIVK